VACSNPLSLSDRYCSAVVMTSRADGWTEPTRGPLEGPVGCPATSSSTSGGVKSTNVTVDEGSEPELVDMSLRGEVGVVATISSRTSATSRFGRRQSPDGQCTRTAHIPLKGESHDFCTKRGIDVHIGQLACEHVHVFRPWPSRFDRMTLTSLRCPQPDYRLRRTASTFLLLGYSSMTLPHEPSARGAGPGPIPLPANCPSTSWRRWLESWSGQRPRGGLDGSSGTRRRGLMD
jgi:hypothetical protein